MDRTTEQVKVTEATEAIDECYTWRWSWEYAGDTCPTAAPGRVFASRKDAEEDIRECERLYDGNTIYHQSPSGERCYRKVYKVSGCVKAALES